MPEGKLNSAGGNLFVKLSISFRNRLALFTLFAFAFRSFAGRFLLPFCSALFTASEKYVQFCLEHVFVYSLMFFQNYKEMGRERERGDEFVCSLIFIKMNKL